MDFIGTSEKQIQMLYVRILRYNVHFFYRLQCLIWLNHEIKYPRYNFSSIHESTTHIPCIPVYIFFFHAHKFDLKLCWLLCIHFDNVVIKYRRTKDDLSKSKREVFYIVAILYTTEKRTTPISLRIIMACL